jgi:haloacetate dehalogenase
MTDPGVTVVNGIRMHYVRAGDGPLVVLLHGWPQTNHCWRHVLPELAKRHTVVAPDLRGYGRTDKPTTGYDKRTMASDVSALIAALGFETARVVGHDRGARVAHRWALDRPDEVERLAVLDVIPTREMWRQDARTAVGYWHWLFAQQPDLPELLAGRDIGTYLGYFFQHWTYNRHGLEPEAIAEYVRAFSVPGALRAGFDDYRASFPDDAALDDADAAAGRRLTMPVLAVWGATGLPSRFPVLDIWREYADDVRGGPIEESGHFLAEEQPAALVERLRAFLG